MRLRPALRRRGARHHRSETPMKTIKGPAIFLAQFAGEQPPFNSLDAHRSAGPPALATRACRSRAGTPACSTCKTRRREQDLLRRSQRHAGRSTASQITELSTHLQGQLVAVHPAYDAGFDGFAAPEVRGNPVRRQQWAVRAAACWRPRRRQPRAHGACDLLRRAGLALSLLVAAAPARADRGGVRRAGAGAGGRSSMPSTTPASTSATRSTRAKTCTTA